MRSSESEKEGAGRAALAEVTSGMTLGLGTGSTVRFFLESLGEALSSGRIRDVRGVATSRDTETRCALLGIPVVELDDGVELDLSVDGADEVSPSLDLVKGLGGALLRERIVVQAARRFVVVVDSAKEVAALGEKVPVPVEVLPFGWRSHLSFFRALGADPCPREGPDGELARTDNGNYLVDLRFFPRIPDPERLERELRGRAGVVGTGLFLQVADRVLVGTVGGVVARERRPA
ncbi:MAG: ribose-5-phosphate isomerase RpiA [Gemmatimonadetes bacterium]|nr:ribose-5-phosphate isomerase RpiA [Gemmatimonadota bacterium]